MLRFPSAPYKSDDSFIAFGAQPFAKHNTVTQTTGRQVGFLTEHSLMFIIQGKKYFHFGEQAACINDNEFILVKRGIYTISEFIPDNGCFKALIIFIPDEFVQSLSSQLSDKHKSQPKDYVILKNTWLLEQFKRHYLNYFGCDFEAKQPLLQLKLQELFLLLLNSDSKELVKSFVASCTNKDSLDIEYVVKKNLLQPLSIEDYAKLCMRSLASFKRDFRKKFNTSPRQWINQQRIFYANALLNNTNKNVSEIALECGFESTSHFIKIFKSQMGFTPGKVRADIARI
jgi:AraC-like DNA-binding protein